MIDMNEFENNMKIPEFCICPITQEIMREPVFVLSGHSFEKEAILEWFAKGNTKNPLTGQLLQLKTVLPNYSLKNAIDYVKNQLQIPLQNTEYFTDIKKAVSIMEQKLEEKIISKEIIIKQDDSIINELLMQLSNIDNLLIKKQSSNITLSKLNSNLSEIDTQFQYLKKESTENNQIIIEENFTTIAIVSGISGDETIKLINIITGECIRTLSGHSSKVICLTKISDNSLASGSADFSIKIWNSETGECIKTLSGHTNVIRSLIKINETTLASGSDDKTVKIWNIVTGECIKTISGHTSYVLSVTKINNTTIISGSEDKTIKIWNTSNGNCFRTLKGHTSKILFLSKINDSKFASGSGDCTIKIWNISNGDCIKTLSGHTSFVYSLAKLNNTALASCSIDKTIKIWNIETGECMKTLKGHSLTIFSLAKVNETTIISGSSDKSLKIWNFTTGECIKTITGHAENFNSIIGLN